MKYFFQHKKIWTRALLLSGILSTTACKKYMNIVPDNLATIDYAFHQQAEAQKYLYTCYSYLPKDSKYDQNPAFGAGDEFFMNTTWTNVTSIPELIALGNLSPSNNWMSNWNSMYAALRDCNIFLENIDNVVDFYPASNRARWKGEVLFLKGYYHYLLLRQFGPVPIVDKNLPVDVDPADAHVYRAPVDSLVNYIANLFDQSAKDLSAAPKIQLSEYGRITPSIALSMKAKLLVMAASPLFNGNTDFASLKGSDKVGSLFNPVYDASKWKRAAEACKAAIDVCEAAGIKLATYGSDPTNPILPEDMALQMGIRLSMTNENWSPELIWGASNSLFEIDDQQLAMPRLDPAHVENEGNKGQLAPTLKMAEMFYTKNGLPINEDNDFDYNARYATRQATGDDAAIILPGYTTANLHFGREPRFYADIGFDGGMWYMKNGMWHIEARFGGPQARKKQDSYSITGYFTKKLVNWNYIIKEKYQNDTKAYPWPIMRLADLYLLYAEALNEAEGPSEGVYNYLNKIRARAGIPTVQDAWSQHAKNPGKYTTKDGLREIIQQERSIELAFEGNRFWDLRRWKKALEQQNQPIKGWAISQSEAAAYYQPTLLANQPFKLRDYFWPINQNDIVVNPNLVQNPGW